MDTPETLEALIDEGNVLLDGANAARVGFEHHRWTRRVRLWLAKTAPNTGLSGQWSALGVSPLVSGGQYYDDSVTWSKHRDLVRYQLRWLANNGPPLVRPPTAPEGVWGLLHPRIVEAAHQRFENGHYADAVEAALKELNATVKELVKSNTGQELDGAALMNTAFSPKNPIIVLDDLRTQSGRDIQLGYMQIYAGSMTGIRNPKAHENLVITSERALHHLFVASLLMWRLDERLSPAPHR